MSRDKQIEEMAKILAKSDDCGDCTNCMHNSWCPDKSDAELIYNAGYRKASNEWINVDERLPELEDGRNWGNHRPRSIRVLCVCQQRSGKTFVKEGYYELFGNKPSWRIPGSIDSVTHWMLLPKAPIKKYTEEGK